MLQGSCYTRMQRRTFEEGGIGVLWLVVEGERHAAVHLLARAQGIGERAWNEC